MKKLICILLVSVNFSLTAQIEHLYPLNIEKSNLNWKGSYAFLFSEHSGTAKFKDGHLQTLNGAITYGSFIIDMNSITNEDYKLNSGPVKHLKHSDFFDVTKHPEAKLVITKVTYYKNGNEHKMEGMLTIKGITKSITFKAIVDETKKTLHTRFKIDRRRWGITYNNKLKNEAIADAIEFEALLFF